MPSPIVSDFNAKTLIGKGSGETWQVAFEGSGWVLIQPSEGRVSGGIGGSGGFMKALGG